MDKEDNLDDKVYIFHDTDSEDEDEDAGSSSAESFPDSDSEDDLELESSTTTTTNLISTPILKHGGKELECHIDSEELVHTTSKEDLDNTNLVCSPILKPAGKESDHEDEESFPDTDSEEELELEFTNLVGGPNLKPAGKESDHEDEESFPDSDTDSEEEFELESTNLVCGPIVNHGGIGLENDGDTDESFPDTASEEELDSTHLVGSPILKPGEKESDREDEESSSGKEETCENCSDDVKTPVEVDQSPWESSDWDVNVNAGVENRVFMTKVKLKLKNMEGRLRFIADLYKKHIKDEAEVKRHKKEKGEKITLDDEDQILVFINHQFECSETFNYIENGLKELGVDFIIMDGPTKRRAQMAKDFADGANKMMVMEDAGRLREGTKEDKLLLEQHQVHNVRYLVNLDLDNVLNFDRRVQLVKESLKPRVDVFTFCPDEDDNHVLEVFESYYNKRNPSRFANSEQEGGPPRRPRTPKRGGRGAGRRDRQY